MKLLVIGVLITSMWVIKVKIFMVLVMYFDNLISTVAIRDHFDFGSIISYTRLYSACCFYIRLLPFCL